MKTIGEFIFELAKKAGIKEDEPSMVAFNADKEFFVKPFPEELEKSIDNNLLSIEAAKNNHPEIKNHYTAAALNGLDARIDKAMDELALPDDVKLVVKNVKSSIERAAFLASKVKDLENKKKSTDGDKDKQSLQSQIDTLQSELRKEKEGIQSLKDSHQKEITDIRTQTKQQEFYANYKTIYDDLPANIRISSIDAIIQNALQDSDAEFRLDDKKQFVLIKKDGSNVFGDDHKLLNPKSFIEKALSQNKVLKVTDPNSAKPGANGNTPNSPIVVPGAQNNGDKKQGSEYLNSLVSTSLKDLESAEKTSLI